jgi:putative two-component system response regulator
VLPIIRSHHERWDGSGYPDGLRGEEIPLLARILQVVDIYDALTTARPYKPAFSHDQAIAILRDEAKRGWRDPDLVQLFAQTFEDLGATSLGTTNLTRPNLASGTLPMQSSLENMRRILAQ